MLYVYRGDLLVAILPLYLERHSLFGKVLAYCGATDLFPDQVDLICDAVDSREAAKSIEDFLNAECGEWDVLESPLLTEESGMCAWLRAPRTRGDLRVEQPAPVSAAPYIEIDGDFESYAAKHKKRRYSLKSRRKRLFSGQGMSYLPCRSGDEQRVLSVLHDLHQQRAKRKGIVSTFARPGLLEFHADFVSRAIDKGWIVLRTLGNGQETIGAFYGFLIGGTLSFYQSGIDPAWEEFGPGMVLLDETIREAHESGCREYNFLQGSERYKFFFTGEKRTLFSARIYGRTFAAWRASAVRRVQSGARELHSSVMSSLPRIRKAGG